MRIETYTKTYSVVEGYYKGRKRFFAVSANTKTALHYATYKKALQVARDFTFQCYKDFDRAFDIKVKFNIHSIGGIEL
jgi:hypothetical protein